MLRPLPWKDKLLSFFVLTLLTPSVEVKADPVCYSSHSFFLTGHNFRISALYTGDTELTRVTDTIAGTVVRDGNVGSSGYVRREKNSDLMITIPETVRGKYRIRFLDAGNNFLFEIRQIKDALLIVEKYNFGHAGWFQYELYKDNALVERNTFLIKTDN